jgi:hypothetical protein
MLHLWWAKKNNAWPGEPLPGVHQWCGNALPYSVVSEFCPFHEPAKNKIHGNKEIWMNF